MIEYNFRFRIPLHILATIKATDAQSALNELQSKLKTAFLAEAKFTDGQLFMAPLKEIECFCIETVRQISMKL